MPLQRCRNFDENGSRKLRNGLEMACHSDCQYVHPSEPAWDRARPSGLRGRGGHPYPPRGRSQSSFGVPGSNRGTSSNSWDDYIPGSSSNPVATSSGWGTSSLDNQATAGTSGWGDSATGDSGRSFNMNNDVGMPERKSAEPAKVSTFQWGGRNADWGAPGGGWGMSDGIGWGSADTGLEPGWGQDSTSNQWGDAPSEAATSNMGSSTVADVGPGRIEDSSDATQTADLVPPVIPADFNSNQHDQSHANQPGGDVTTPTTGDPFPMEREVSSSTSLLRLPPAVHSMNKSQARTQSEGNGGRVTLISSTDSETSKLALCIAATLKMRKLDAELVHWSALRKSPRLVMPRVDKDLLQTRYQEFKDTQLAAKSAVESRTAQLGLPNILSSSIARAQDTGRLHQLEAWVLRAEGCLSNLPPEGDFALHATPHVKKEDAPIDKLKQLKERLDSLTGTQWQCQDPQFYHDLLDHQLQDKKDLIISTIVKGQETAYSHLLSTSFSTVQQQGEIWNQKLQVHAGELAQTLLQSSNLEKEGKNRSVLKTNNKSIIEKLQTRIAQKRSQIQAMEKEMAQLHHTLTLTNQQSPITSDSLDVYAPHIQKCTQSYIQGNALSGIKKVLVIGAERKGQKHSITHNIQEEVEMNEIENTLLG